MNQRTQAVGRSTPKSTKSNMSHRLRSCPKPPILVPRLKSVRLGNSGCLSEQLRLSCTIAMVDAGQIALKYRSFLSVRIQVIVFDLGPFWLNSNATLKPAGFRSPLKSVPGRILKPSTPSTVR